MADRHPSADQAPSAPHPTSLGSMATPPLGEHVPTVRVFGSPAFFRLWLAQVVSSLGDWLGFVAITAIAARIGKSSPDAAVGVVLSARLVPGFFLAPAAGVFIDRWDRKRVMVACDVGRGLVLVSLPFINSLPMLVLVSFLLEVMTLLWSPAKEASVPNIVRHEFLANANSLSLVAAYGTFPIGSALFAALAGVAKWLGSYHALKSLQVSQESIAIWFDVATFFVSAIMISTLTLPKRKHADEPHDGRLDLGRTFRELAEGWRFIGESSRVRSVIIGIATGLVGGGMVVPLGVVMSREVLHGGSAGFGLLLTALGTGVAFGIISLSVVQRRLPHERIFMFALFGAGACQLAGASMSSLLPAMVFVSILGVCAGAVYILGFTILQTNVEDHMRGRIFATLYTLIRFCLLVAFAVAPILSSLLDGVSRSLFHRHLNLFGLGIGLPGVRLTLWLGGLIIMGAGLLARVSLRDNATAAE